MAFFNRFQKNTLALSVLGATLLLTGCGGGGSDGGSNTSTPSTQKVSIEFAALAGTLPIKCGEKITNIGSTSATVELQDLRFYVSDVHLMNAADQEIPVTLDRNEWQAEGVALVDLEDGAGACAENTLNDASGKPLPNTIRAVVTGTVPVGQYTGVGYTVGVPHTINHSDYNRAPFDIQSMGWGWQAGRRFLKLEIKPDDKVTLLNGSTSNAWMVHLGAGDCKGDPRKGEITACTYPNRMAFHAHSFDANTQKIAVDLQSFFATSDVTKDAGNAVGCMANPSDPECTTIFAKLKIDLATGLPTDGGHGQGLFKVVSK